MSMLLEPPMTSLADALKPKRPATPPELDIIDLVRDMAVSWDAGEIPLVEVQKLSSGPKRWLTTRFTPPDHEAFGPLMRLLDALIADAKTDRGDLYKTKHGYFSRQDLIDNEARVVRDDGKTLFLFPVRYPWDEKPDAERGKEGKRKPAIHRSAEERKPMYGQFGQKAPAAPMTKDVPWWDMKDDEAES